MCGGGGFLKDLLPILGAAAGTILLPGIGTALGAGSLLGEAGGAALDLGLNAGIGSTVGGLAAGEKPGQALKGGLETGALAGISDFAGSELGLLGSSGAAPAASGGASGATDAASALGVSPAGASAAAPAGASAAGLAGAATPGVVPVADAIPVAGTDLTAPAGLNLGGATLGAAPAASAADSLGITFGGAPAAAGGLGEAPAGVASFAQNAGGAPSLLSKIGGAASGVGDTLKTALSKENPLSLATAGLGLGYDVLSGNKQPAGSAQLKQQADQLAQQGAIEQQYLTTGKLPAGVQASVDQQTAQAIAQIRSKYAQLGLSGSTAEQQDIAAARQQAVQTAGQGLLTTGLQSTGTAANLYGQIASLNQQQSDNTGKAIANLAAALSGGSGVNIKIPGANG